MNINREFQRMVRSCVIVLVKEIGNVIVPRVSMLVEYVIQHMNLAFKGRCLGFIPDVMQVSR
jgi:hypothetical protein